MKLIKKLIIAALIVLGAGAIVSISALAAAGFDVNELDRQHYAERMESVSESSSVASVNIKSSAYDIKVVTAEAGEISVKAFDGEDVKTTVTKEGNAVNINIDDSRSWYDKMVGSIGRERELIIYIPKGISYSLVAQTESADIELMYEGTFASLEIKTESGEIELERTKVSGNVSLSANSGDISLSGINVEGKTNVKTNSGDVEFEYIKVGEVYIETASGDVEGEVLTPMNFSVTTNSGRTRISEAVKSSSGSLFKIKTNSGNIEIDIDD